MVRIAEEIPCVEWDDDEIIKYAQRAKLPIVYVTLSFAVDDMQPDTALVDFFADPAIVRRFRRAALKFE